MDKKTVIEQLRQNGWKVRHQLGSRFNFPPNILNRYPKLPSELVDFLSDLSVCTNADETSWFLCESDFSATGSSAFRWNEWELLSIKAAGGDAEVIAEVAAFWDTHFPIMLSVHSGYAFHAVCTNEECFGQVVEGFEPEFEDARPVANSFGEFLPTLFQDGRNE